MVAIVFNKNSYPKKFIVIIIFKEIFVIKFTISATLNGKIYLSLKIIKKNLSNIKKNNIFKKKILYFNYYLTNI